MKIEARNLARKLRTQGFSINQIKDKIGVSKGSVSLWVRDIEMTVENRSKLLASGISSAVIEKRRRTRLDRESAKRQIIIDRAKSEIFKISDKELKLIGAMLYWAEGGKTQRGLVRFSNSDPIMIKLMMVFFRNVCNVPEKNFRGYFHIHPHLDSRKAEKYWSNVAGIPLHQFFKTYRKMNVSSKQKRDTAPFGTLDVYICNTELFLKIKGWTEGICGRYLK